MNLENLGLVELNAQEMKETEGGLFFLLVGLVLLVAAAYSVLVIGQRE